MAGCLTASFIPAEPIQDTLLVHPREVFRLAIATAASAVVVICNLPER